MWGHDGGVDVMLICESNDEDSELASFLLFDAGATAVGEHTSEASLELHAGFTDLHTANSAAAALAPRPCTIREVKADWVVSQQDGFSPIEIGPWLVRAPWHTCETDLVELVIDPGPAFGHGNHPTTRLMLNEIANVVEAGTDVLDVGTGTGVLALAAASLGARVVGVDTDEAAVTQARLNVESSAWADHIDIHHRTAELADTTAIAVALVNVTIDQQRLIAPIVQEVPVVVLSGLIETQVAEAESLYPNHVRVSLAVDDEWQALVLKIRGS